MPDGRRSTAQQSRRQASPDQQHGCLDDCIQQKHRHYVAGGSDQTRVTHLSALLSSFDNEPFDAIQIIVGQGLGTGIQDGGHGIGG
jgi:hypothetical protein